MATLPTNRTTANTPAEHVADHNTLHTQHNLLESAGWATYTPAITQSGDVTKTVTYARWVQLGKTVHVVVTLAVTGTGSANNRVTVSLPVTAHASLTGGVATIGSGRIFDSSAGVVYRGVPVCQSTTTVRIEATGHTTTGIAGDGLGAVGTPFTAALASGDIVEFSATYEAA